MTKCSGVILIHSIILTATLCSAIVLIALGSSDPFQTTTGTFVGINNNTQLCDFYAPVINSIVSVPCNPDNYAIEYVYPMYYKYESNIVNTTIEPVVSYVRPSTYRPSSGGSSKPAVIDRSSFTLNKASFDSIVAKYQLFRTISYACWGLVGLHIVVIIVLIIIHERKKVNDFKRNIQLAQQRTQEMHRTGGDYA